MNNSLKHSILLMMSGAILSSPIIAQAQQPDAGSLLRDIEAQQPNLDAPVRFGSELPPPLPDTGDTIKLMSLTFEGYEDLVTESELRALLSDAIGRELGFNGLMFLAERVTEYLKNKGYFLAYAYLPEQDISGGVLLIMIQAGRIEGGGNWDHLLEDKTVKLSDRRIVNTLNNALKADKSGVIQANQMERGLLLFNDLAGISARSDLTAGSEPGTTRVDVIFEETPRYHGIGWVDNYGNYYTGTNRINAMGNIDNLSGMGDQLNLMASVTSGLNYGRLGYQAPLGYTGLTINPYMSHLNYKLGEDFANSGFEGTATTVGAELRYPIIRSRSSNLNIQTSFEYRTQEDDRGELTIEKRFNTVQVALQGNQTDLRSGGGVTQYKLGLKRGSFQENSNIPELFPTKNMTYSLMTANISRLQNLLPRWNGFVAVDSQFAPSRNLDSSEKFSLGGINSVRAYPSGESSGDMGFKVTVEARYELSNPGNLGGDWQLQLFIDHGSVSRNKDGLDDNLPNRNDLTGAGVGFSWSEPNSYSVKASYAVKINDKPFDRRDSGLDSENKDNDGRFWLQAMVWF